MKHLDAQKDNIIADYKKGLSLRNLAKHYMCSVNTMIKYLKLWGIKAEAK